MTPTPSSCTSLRRVSVPCSFFKRPRRPATFHDAMRHTAADGSTADWRGVGVRLTDEPAVGAADKAVANEAGSGPGEAGREVGDVEGDSGICGALARVGSTASSACEPVDGATDPFHASNRRTSSALLPETFNPRSRSSICNALTVSRDQPSRGSAPLRPSRTAASSNSSHSTGTPRRTGRQLGAHAMAVTR
eukprot:scaffold19347_cov157-Isochrysis_galbana.AAC.1